MRMHIAQLQREKINELTADVNAAAKLVMDEMALESGEAEEQLTAKRQEAKQKLRLQLELKQREQAQALLKQMDSIAVDDNLASSSARTLSNDIDSTSSRPSLGRTVSRTMSLMAEELRSCGIESETEIDNYVDLLKQQGYDTPEDLRELVLEDGGVDELDQMGFKKNHRKKIQRRLA